MSTHERPTLIVGAGLAGLSTAYHLKEIPSIIVERESEVGGTARSFSVAGFTFDITGHLLHLHNSYTKELIRKLLKNQFFTCFRKALIYSHGTLTKYPFQAYTKGLPENVIDDCVLGFFKVLHQNKKKSSSNINFKAWCYQTFGRGISKNFMIPYNEKLYQTKPQNMTIDWCGPFVPTPKLEDVMRGALEDEERSFGYNTTFLYPKRGGIQSLAKALSKPLKDIYLNTHINHIDWKRQLASLSTGETIAYSHLVNSIPLLELLKLMSPLPSNVEEARRQLKFASIICINIGVHRENISDASWIYFPEKKFPFYRIGFPMNFTPHVVPKGHSSMYVEVPNFGNEKISKAQLLRRVRSGLIEAGILRSSDKLSVVQFIPVKYAYVIFDKNRQNSLHTIFTFLSKYKIQSIGRYGEWKYSFMEEAILDGKKAAEHILNDTRSTTY